MSNYFEFECSVCSLQGGGLDRHAGDRWDASLIATMKFFIHHVKVCDPASFVVRCDTAGDGEYGARPGTQFIPATLRVFPMSGDWELVARAKRVKDLDRRWSKSIRRTKRRRRGTPR